jgi:hypothetical protein
LCDLCDFNNPDINWERGTAKGRRRELMEAVEDAMMEQLVNFPTHIKGNILDLMITNKPERVVAVAEAGRLGQSDHTVIVTKIQMNQDIEEEVEQIVNWWRADWAGCGASYKKLTGMNCWRASQHHPQASSAIW